MSPQTLTRLELYELAWSTPLITLAKKYLISDVGLRKICVRMNIPLPQAGHWAIAKYGSPPKKIKLPGNYSGEDTVTLKIRGPESESITGTPSEIKILEKSIIDAEGERLNISESLVKPDKLIIQARSSLTEKPKHHDWRGVRGTNRNELRISVATNLSSG